MSDTTLRARSTSEIVDAAFALYRRNAMQYIVLTAICYSPVLIVSLLLVARGPAIGTGALFAALPVYIVTMLAFAVVSAAIVRIGSDVYLGREPDVNATIKAVMPRLPALIGGAILASLLAFVGLLLFIFPVFYVLTVTFAINPAIVLENKGPTDALSRSVALTKGRKGHVFLTLLLTWGLYLVLSIGITIVAGLVGSAVLLQIVSSLLAIFAYPIINLVVMVLYYDMRIRGEGFDVEHMSQSTGAPPVMSPMGSAAV